MRPVPTYPWGDITMSEPTPEPTQEQIEQALHDGPDPIERNGVVYVGLKLSNPLSAEQAAHMQALVTKPYSVGHTIRLQREWAGALIDAGYAQVDRENKAAVQAALYLNARNQPLSMAEVAEARAAAAVAAAEQAAEEAERLVAAEAEAAERIAAAQERAAAAQERLRAARAQAAGAVVEANPNAGGDADAAVPAKTERQQSAAGSKAK